jgi:ribokinase
VDTTGAGDAFAGTLAAVLATGAPLADAVRLGTAAGAISVERAGAAVSMPTRAEVDSRLAR